MIKLVIGRRYHIQGWRKAYQLRLLKYDQQFAYLESPKTHRKWTISIERLTPTNRHGGKNVKII